jgi:SNF2 family DNA or RNA helicase
MVKIDQVGNSLSIKISGDKFYDIIYIVKSYNCKFNAANKTWVTQEGANHVDLIKDIRKIDDNILLDSNLQSKIGEAQDKDTVIQSVGTSSIEAEPFTIKRLNVDLYPHQYGDVAFLSGRTKALLANTVGVGKTYSMIATCLYLKQLGLIKKVIIFSPSSIIKEWKYQIENGTKEELNIIEDDFKSDKFFNIISFDSVFNRIASKIRNSTKEKLKTNKKNLKIIDEEYDCMVIDEVHMASHAKTKRLKALRRIAKHKKYVYGMSATPVQNNLDELYYIFNSYINDKLINFMEYRHKYCIMGGFMNKQTVGYKNIPQFVKLIAPYVRRVEKNQISNKFPKRTERHIWIEMNREQKEFYDKVVNQIIEIKSDPTRERKIIEAQKLALTNYLKQACASSYQIDKMTTQSSKIDTLIDILKEKIKNGEKTIVFCEYRDTCGLIEKALNKHKIGVIYANADNNDIDMIKSEFKKDKNDVLLMTRVFNMGVNLEMANNFIFFSLLFNPQVMTQLSGRIDRITQTKPIEVTYFITKNTYEENIWDILMKKTDLANQTTNTFTVKKGKEDDIIWNNI